MLERFIYLFSNLPLRWIVFLTAMLPVSELRGAIPLGFALGLPRQEIIFLSFLGNFLPVPFILILLEPLSRKLRRFRFWKRFFDWLFSRTQKRANIVERYEFWGLVIFVGIPLPMTGAWTGAIAASLIGIRFIKAALAITLGVVMAGIAVTYLVSTGKLLISFHP